MDSWIDSYLDRISDLAFGEPSFYTISESVEEPPITLINYPSSSNERMQISFTAGLSAYDHESWRLGKPELSIAMDSSDKSWGFAIGEVADRLKGDCPFCYCDVINFGAPISEESELSAFIVFAPSFGPKELFSLELDDRKINIAQMYPVYSNEIEVFEKIGPKEFFSSLQTFSKIRYVPL